MKRFLFAALMIFTTISFTAVAQDSEKSVRPQYKYEYQEAKISYHNVRVYKVLDHREAYIVMYARGREVGTAVIPKRWYNEHPRKLAFRSLPANMDPYMTVITKEGEFNYVILTMPVHRGNPAWGVADSNQEVDASIDKLELQY